MNSKMTSSISIILSVIVIFGTIQSAHAHGLGSVESDMQFFNESSLR